MKETHVYYLGWKIILQQKDEIFSLKEMIQKKFQKILIQSSKKSSWIVLWK
jgi:hypothetical protein